MELKDCFREEFSHWLLKSNKKNLHESEIDHDKFVEDSLTEILNVLLKEPLADCFWYGYPEYGGKLYYTIPNKHSVIHTTTEDLLRVDKEKIKIFLRDYKVENILNQ